MDDIVDRFNPQMKYTMTKSQLRRLLLKTPRPAMWWGATYTIKSKHLGAGIYSVTGDFKDRSWEDGP